MKYVIYRDHGSLAVVSEHDYNVLKGIYAAMGASTWGEFMGTLPDSERDALLFRHGTDLFGSDFVVWDDPEEEAEAKEDLFYRDTPFNPEQLPGYSDGDYPFWPRNYFQIKDGVCIAIYEEFGTWEALMIQTMYFLPDDATPRIREWLKARGYTLEERDDPSK